MKYETKLQIWSKVGHCPISKRTGSWCDKLDERTESFASPSEARLALKKFMESDPDTHTGYYEMDTLRDFGLSEYERRGYIEA